MAVRDWLSVTESTLKCAALIIGAGWAVWLFFQKREPYPRLRLKQVFTTIPVDPSRRVVRVDLEIENVGTKLAKISSIEMRLQQVAPPARLGTGPFPVAQPSGRQTEWGAETEILWPELHKYKLTFSEGFREVEPGEQDSLQFDFVVGADVQIIQAYAFLSNPEKRNASASYDQPKEIGWMVTSLYSIAEGLMKSAEGAGVVALTKPDKPA